MSRATLMDLNPEEENLDQIGETEAVEAQPEEVEEPQQTEDDFEIPEKYQGKSLKEVVQMHQEAEKLMSRHSSEVGELRQVVDEYISTQARQAPETESVEEDDIDYFTDPKSAMHRAIENHPKIKEAEQYTTEYKKQSALATLNAKHPDMNEILSDEGFAKWIKSSKIRTQLFVSADQQYNADAADELFSLWKERKTVNQQTVDLEKQARKQQLKAANTGNARGTDEGPRKKQYRRSDLIKLMKDDPERYQSMSAEILQAYAEGRVK